LLNLSSISFAYGLIFIFTTIVWLSLNFTSNSTSPSTLLSYKQWINVSSKSKIKVLLYFGSCSNSSCNSDFRFLYFLQNISWLNVSMKWLLQFLNNNHTIYNNTNVNNHSLSIYKFTANSHLGNTVPTLSVSSYNSRNIHNRLPASGKTKF